MSYTAPTGQQVLDRVSLKPPAGRLTLVCGASGSGKTTLVRLVNGLIPHFHHGERTGEVLIGGREVARIPLGEMGRFTATVFQNPATQFFTTTVADELAFAAQNYGVPPEEIIRRRLGALKELGLEDLADRDLRGLSGGQLQKVACAQALTQQAPVILLDEPTSNLDPEGIEGIRSVIARLKALKRTIIVAEHRVHFLGGLVDQAVVMDDGRIVRRMSGAELFSMGDAERRRLGLRSLTRPELPRRTCCGSPLEVVDVPAVRAAGASRARGPKERRGLVISDMVVERGGRRILDLEHLDFPEGRVTGIIGANGIGKTTLVRAICRLQRCQRRARIELDGRPLGRGQAFLVMQDVHRQLFAESVADEASAHRLQRLGLAALADRHPLSLSGGQKQRLVIATAIDQDARVIILDEPTSGVDHRHLLSIATELRALAAQGRVVIVVSHDDEFLAECADRIIRLL
ncbi:ABC transporter ATP-binding protein [Actinomyces slackii]|uniref:ABC transporter ATP-binding protein n=1 Tax=Actinomyces slackii TaxID=52774 RepID=UPI001E38B943|nr:ABC transporter ATP-binding protein [Actinomyces slackii]